MRFLSNLRIRTKLWLGFGILLFILSVVAVNVFLSLNRIGQQTEQVVNDIQPVVFDAMELVAKLDAANKSLGFYLLSKEPQHKQDYLQALAQIDKLLEQLKRSPVAQSDSATAAKLDSLTEKVGRFKGFREKMLTLAEDNIANQPAFAYAAENINPSSQKMLQLLSQMVLAEKQETPTAQRRELLLLITDMRYAWVNIMSSLRGYLAFRTESTLTEIANYREMLEARMTAIAEYEDLLTLDQYDSLEQLNEAYAVIDGNFPELVKIHGGEQWRTDAYLIRTDLGEVLGAIHADLDTLLVKLRADIESQGNDMLSQTESTRSVVIGMSLLALLIGVAAAWLLSRLIVQPINAAASAMNEIAAGGGDLTCSIHLRSDDELGQLCKAFNRFVEKIREIVGPVSQSTAQLSDAANHMSAVTEQTRAGVQRQQQETEQVATAMNEMVATAQEMVDNARMAADATQQADSEAQSGSEVVRQTINRNNELADAVERAAGVIQRLEADSESIGKVLDVIRDIAEQTNLLALNAAIEAARAGEQGRGFAVVADEVRSLASRSQESTQEIHAIIEQLQNGAREAVSVMNDGREQARSSVEQAAKAGESLKEITRAVASIREMNLHISEAAKQQGEVAEEINRNLSTITEVAEQTSQGTGSLEEASGQLGGLSQQLQSEVAEQTSQGTGSLEEASGQLGGLSQQLQSLVGHFRT
jgi:methyl-accepting chemotaxis protein